MKQKVTLQDWDKLQVIYDSSSILQTILEGQSPNLHLGFIEVLYKKYRLGDWNEEIPDPNSLVDKSYLAWSDEAYCMFHKIHDRFGEHIIECALPYLKHVFVFFDYSSLYGVFDALDDDEHVPHVPHVPIYHATFEDRYDFRNSEHLW